MNTTWLVVAGWTAGWLLLWRLPRLTDPQPPPREHRISIIVPARNEGDRLPDLLDSLATQTLSPHEVIVVDDDSADDTHAVATSYRHVRVMSSPPLPDGWTGKCWSCHTGVAAASGDLLVFLDADVRLAPAALESTVGLWEQSGGLVSVQPRHDPDRAIEALSLPFNVVALMGLGIGSVLPPAEEWGVSGPCMVTDRQTYNEIGGHASVRGAVAEDLALGRRYTENGHSLSCVAGGDRVRFRMYRTLPALFEGWSKNMATGARRAPILRTAAIVLWIAALLTAAGAVVGHATDQGSGLAWALAIYTAVALQLGVFGHRVGRFGPAALVWPVLVAFFVTTFMWSAWLSLGLGRVRWSGRSIALGRTSR